VTEEEDFSQGVPFVSGPPTPANLRFKENWVRSGDFARALEATRRREEEGSRRNRERGLAEATLLVRDAKAFVLHGRRSVPFWAREQMPPPRGREIRSATGGVWVEVGAGRWRLCPCTPSNS